MRLLTIGTIFVAGGLMAAIPFRRDHLPSEERVDSALVTGPTEALTMTPSAVSFDPLSPAGATTPVHSASHPMPDQVAWDNPPTAIPTSQPARSRRSLDLPLTYDDLAVPLNNPHFVDQRFDALAQQRPSTSDTHAMPTDRYQSFSVASQSPAVPERASRWALPNEASESVLTTGDITSREPSPVAGRLISAERPPNNASPAKAPAPPTRKRLWIRQPD